MEQIPVQPAWLIPVIPEAAYRFLYLNQARLIGIRLQVNLNDEKIKIHFIIEN